MSTKIYFIFLLSSFFILANVDLLQAQYSFRVIASAGESTCNSQVLASGNRLDQSDVVSVKPKSYLSLIHRSGGTVQISTESKSINRSISNLEENLKKRKYLNYIISERNSSSSRHKYINVLGAIERGGMFPAYLARFTYLSQAEFNIRWEELAQVKEYLIIIRDFEGKELQRYQTRSNEIQLNAQDFFAQAEGERFIVYIQDKNGPLAKDGFALQLLDRSAKQGLVSDFNSFQKELTGTDNAYDKISKAAFYEEHQLFLDALRCYEELLALPASKDDFEVYKLAYRQFLARHDLVKLTR